MIIITSHKTFGVKKNIPKFIKYILIKYSILNLSIISLILRKLSDFRTRSAMTVTVKLSSILEFDITD